MKRRALWGVLVVVGLLVPMALLLLSCGGGGGSSSTGSSSTGVTGTSSVSVLLADGPAAAYDQILITITEVSLIPEGRGGQPVVIFQNSQGVQVNLLDLRDEDFLLAVRKDVTAGTYAKIRLEISDIEARGKQGANAPCDGQNIKLPSGRIDLNPQHPFRVIPGGALAIRLDMDANKSLSLHEAGKSGKCIFRPVVFVDIEEVAAVARCPKILSGTIFKLLRNDANTQTVGFILTLADNRGDLEVDLSSETNIFDENGEFVDASALEVGQDVKVRGKFSRSGNLDASLVVIGNVFDVSGQVDGPVDSTTDLFPLTPFASQALVGQHEFKVANDTLILLECDTEVGPDSIQAGMTARVFYKEVSVGGGDERRAVAIFLKPREVTGQITAINGNVVTIQPDTGSAVKVFVPTNTPAYLEGDGVLTSDYLCLGREVRVVLDPDKPLQPAATAVYVEADHLVGTVTAPDQTSRTLMVAGEPVTVQPGATIIDKRTSEDKLVTFDAITTNSTVECFGLVPCSGGGFDGFVVVITQ